MKMWPLKSSAIREDTRLIARCPCCVRGLLLVEFQERGDFQKFLRFMRISTAMEQGWLNGHAEIFCDLQMGK